LSTYRNLINYFLSSMYSYFEGKFYLENMIRLASEALEKERN